MALGYNGRRALVAQWIEHLPPEQGVVGSIPIEGTICLLGLTLRRSYLPPSRNFFRVTKFHTITTAVATILVMR